MKIAAVTTAYNELDTIDLYEKYLKEYWDELYLHIIVDNNSCEEYKNELKKRFKDSVIIFRSTNGGTTAAFNDGVKYALDKGADLILLITQDIKFEKGSLKKLVKLFEEDNKIGIVGPILLKPDGKTIEEYGGKINLDTFKVEKYYANEILNDHIPEFLYVDFIAGGICLIRAEVFKEIGYQDESLFMYSDETDFDYRASKKGWKLLVTKNSIAYHIHKGEKSSLKPKNLFYIIRNQFILVGKHNGKEKLLKFFIFSILKIIRMIAHYIKRKKFDLAYNYFLGTISGLLLGLLYKHDK